MGARTEDTTNRSWLNRIVLAIAIAAITAYFRERQFAKNHPAKSH